MPLARRPAPRIVLLRAKLAGGRATDRLGYLAENSSGSEVLGGAFRCEADTIGVELRKLLGYLRPRLRWRWREIRSDPLPFEMPCEQLRNLRVTMDDGQIAGFVLRVPKERGRTIGAIASLGIGRVRY